MPRLKIRKRVIFNQFKSVSDLNVSDLAISGQSALAYNQFQNFNFSFHK